MNNKILVNNIKKLCSDNGISISTLEKEMYLSPGLISRWTKNTPALDRILEIANYFNVSLDTLVGSANDEKNNDNKIIHRLVITLQKMTYNADIKWYAFNPKYTEDSIIDKIISSIVNQKNIDCFYCKINNGYFFFTINYTNEEKDLSLYVLADQNSTPELKCSDNEELHELCDYLFKLYSEQLNTIKTDNFIEDFINQNNNVSSNAKIALLKNVSNE